MKISYTKMRDDLANVLDALRSGEEVTITQRGKPDIVLNASNSGVEKPTWRNSNSQLKRSPAERQHLKAKTEVGRDRFGPVITLHGNGSIRSKNASSGALRSLSFSEAKKRTQTKHAVIIKALEDK